MAGWVLAVVLVALAATLSVELSAQPTTPVPPEVMAKNLAENVLGEQTVKRVEVSGGGRHIDIAWESATYQRSHSRETTRDLLRSEAELATGSIMGVMHPEAIRYAILLGQRTLASGQHTRDAGFSITYANELKG